MADVKWIKITTDVFDDEKILLIESLPDAYSIIVVWFKLLCLAGKQNNSGVFMMGQIAYTDKMLATIFRMRESVVTMALQTFEQFGMIEIIDGVITIPNWGKHQNLDQLESKKQYMRNYMKGYREKQKALTCKDNCKTNSKANVSQADKERDKEEDKELDIKDIMSDSDESAPLPPKKTKPVKHKYGEYKNVLLTDEELQKLKTEYSDYEERIERLSSYVASTGKAYKSHYATIRNWARKDAEKPGRKEIVPSWMDKPKKPGFSTFQQNEYDFDTLEAELLANGTRTAGNDPDVAARAEALKKQLGGA